jgi:hypothetical protein
VKEEPGAAGAAEGAVPELALFAAYVTFQGNWKAM